MLRYVYADQLNQCPRLKDEMFTHRADQFRTRLGWAGMSPSMRGGTNVMNTTRSTRSM